MIMKYQYITEYILNFYHINFLCLFCRKKLKIIVLACYSFYIAILWACFHHDPHIYVFVVTLNILCRPLRVGSTYCFTDVRVGLRVGVCVTPITTGAPA